MKKKIKSELGKINLKLSRNTHDLLIKTQNFMGFGVELVRKLN